MSPKALDILFVEDDDDHAELVTRSLAEHQVINHLHRVCDGEAALDYALKTGSYANSDAPLPDVILLDLRLPKVDGLDVLRELKSHPDLRRIPVVVLTTSDKDTDIARACDLKANAYLVKPIDFSEFLDLMRDLGFVWLAWTKPPAASRN